MSAELSSMSNADPEDEEFLIASGGDWRAKECRGCGQRPDDLARLDAIAVAAYLRRRFTSLLDNPEHSLRHRGPGRGSWSAMEPAARVSNVLGAANARLRDLLGEEPLIPAGTAIEAVLSVTSPQTISAVLSSLVENVKLLTATIAGATAADWRRPGPDGGATAGQLVWLALHDATHHLEDAELLLDAAVSKARPPRPISTIHPVERQAGPTTP